MSELRSPSALAIALLLSSLALPAGAAPFPFSAKLTLYVGSLPPVVVTGKRKRDLRGRRR